MRPDLLLCLRRCSSREFFETEQNSGDAPGALINTAQVSSEGSEEVDRVDHMLTVG